MTFHKFNNTQVTDAAIAGWLKYHERRAREVAENPFLAAAGTNGAGLRDLAIIHEMRARITVAATPAGATAPALSTFAQQITWEPSADDLELIAFVDGKRVGSLTVWTDNKTGEVSWWGITIVQEGANKEVGVENTLSEAKARLAREVEASTK